MAVCCPKLDFEPSRIREMGRFDGAQRQRLTCTRLQPRDIGLRGPVHLTPKRLNRLPWGAVGHRREIVLRAVSAVWSLRGTRAMAAEVNGVGSRREPPGPNRRLPAAWIPVSFSTLQDQGWGVGGLTGSSAGKGSGPSDSSGGNGTGPERTSKMATADQWLLQSASGAAVSSPLASTDPSGTPAAHHNKRANREFRRDVLLYLMRSGFAGVRAAGELRGLSPTTRRPTLWRPARTARVENTGCSQPTAHGTSRRPGRGGT